MCVCVLQFWMNEWMHEGMNYTIYIPPLKDIDVNFKFQLYMEDPVYRKPVLTLPNELSKPGERANDIGLISAVAEIRIHNRLIDKPASYRWTVNTLFR